MTRLTKKHNTFCHTKEHTLTHLLPKRSDEFLSVTKKQYLTFILKVQEERVRQHFAFGTQF